MKYFYKRFEKLHINNAKSQKKNDKNNLSFFFISLY